MDAQMDRCRFLMEDGTQCSRTKAHESEFCEQHANWLIVDLEVYRVVSDHFKQDVREFWTRSNFYLLVEAGLVSVFVASVPLESGFERSVTVAMGILGLSVAITWFIVAKGAVVWIRRWREATIEIDNVVDRHEIYSKVESLAQSAPLLSPSNVTQYLPLLFCVGWIMLIGLAIWSP